MGRRIVVVLCCGIFWMSAPAAAMERWNCTIHASASFGGTETSPGHVQMQIDGNDLSWVTPNFTVLGKEYPGSTQHRPVILNNDVGIVAVSAIATTAVPRILLNGRDNEQFSKMATSMIPNPRVQAYATVLDKHNGTLRVGSVGTTKVQEIDLGECTQEASPNPATPPSSN